jgi:redox-regulated HSP33 family molecular chaperone
MPQIPQFRDWDTDIFPNALLSLRTLPCIFATKMMISLYKRSLLLRWRRSTDYVSFCRAYSSITRESLAASEDIVLSALSSDSAVLVRVASCRELIQDLIIKSNISADASKPLAEVMCSVLLMGAGLKQGESLQVNFVGSDPAALRNIICITDGDCYVRGRVGNPNFTASPASETRVSGQRESSSSSSKVDLLLGKGGQLQVVRDHPSYKHAMSGFVDIRHDETLPRNIALYMQESEGRRAELLTHVGIEQEIFCTHALAVLIEYLPGTDHDTISKVQAGFEHVARRGLQSYLNDATTNTNTNTITNTSTNTNTTASKGIDTDTPSYCRIDGDADGGDMSLIPAAQRIIDDCLQNVGGVRSVTKSWLKRPAFRCSCSLEKVWRTLRLLPRSEINDIVLTNEGPVSVKCEFCGSAYAVPLDEIRSQLLDVKD